MVVTTIGPANIATSVSIVSAGRLEAGRGKPFLHMRSCLRLPGLANELVAHNPRWCALGLFAQAFCLLRQTLIEWGAFLETASLHGSAPFLWRRERKPAFSSPMEATDRAVISHSGMPSGYLMVNIDHRNVNGIARQREPAGPPSAL